MKLMKPFLMIVGLGATFAALSFAETPSVSSACAAPEYHQLDFWIGDWDAFDFGRPDVAVARLRVDPILDGCVVREDYQGSDGHKGQSFSLYDATHKQWHQSWVTNRAEFLLLDGHFAGGEMILEGHDIHEGKPREVRGIWKATEGGVRETAFTSADGGTTWKPWFDLIFRPHKR